MLIRVGYLERDFFVVHASGRSDQDLSQRLI